MWVSEQSRRAVILVHEHVTDDTHRKCLEFFLYEYLRSYKNMKNNNELSLEVIFITRVLHLHPEGGTDATKTRVSRCA
jgi:hypothetical protein